MHKHGQSSIWDNLMRIMPELKDRIMKSPDYIDPIAAKSLYNIWRTGSQSEDEKIFKKPVTLSRDDLTRMKDAGLIKPIGDNIEITDRGSKVIRVMILGDDKSIYDDDGTIIDYSAAIDQMKGVKTAKKLKAASSWWDRYGDNNGNV